MRERLAHVQFRGAIRERRAEPYVQLLRALGRANRIRGVLLDISSGGGEEVASRALYNAVKRLDAEKPVIASIGSIGASGAYLAALGARRIYAYPQSSVGSIGVVLPHLAVRGLLEKLGIEVELLHAGRHKDAYQGVRPLTDEERAKLQQLLDESRQDFIETVAAARHRTTAEIEPLATGEFWSGRRALALGLVDALGDREDALAELARITGVAVEKTVRVGPPRSFLERFLGGGMYAARAQLEEAMLGAFDELGWDGLLGGYR